MGRPQQRCPPLPCLLRQWPPVLPPPVRQPPVRQLLERPQGRRQLLARRCRLLHCQQRPRCAAPACCRYRCWYRCCPPRQQPPCRCPRRCRWHLPQLPLPQQQQQQRCCLRRCRWHLPQLPLPLPQRHRCRWHRCQMAPCFYLAPCFFALPQLRLHHADRAIHARRMRPQWPPTPPLHGSPPVLHKPTNLLSCTQSLLHFVVPNYRLLPQHAGPPHSPVGRLRLVTVHRTGHVT